MDSVNFTEAPPTSLLSMLGFDDGPVCKPADLTRFCKVQPHTRATTITQSPFRGLTFVTPKQRVEYFYQATACTDDNETQFLLGTASNDARKPAPRLLDMGVFKNTLVIAPKSFFPAGAVLGDKAIPPEEGDLLALLDDDVKAEFPEGEELFAGRLPNSLPLPGGFPKMYEGKASEQSVQSHIKDLCGSHGSSWLYLITRHSEAVQTALLTTDTLHLNCQIYR